MRREVSMTRDGNAQHGQGGVAGSGMLTTSQMVIGILSQVVCHDNRGARSWTEGRCPTTIYQLLACWRRSGLEAWRSARDQRGPVGSSRQLKTVTKTKE